MVKDANINLNYISPNKKKYIVSDNIYNFYHREFYREIFFLLSFNQANNQTD